MTAKVAIEAMQLVSIEVECYAVHKADETPRRNPSGITSSHGASRAFMFAEVDLLEKQFDYDAAPPLERLLIDLILTARLWLIHAENTYNSVVVHQSIPLAQAVYRDNLLSSTQARLLRAIEALARVRRLARNTPALQINIAREGGQQVHFQGGVKGQEGNGIARKETPVKSNARTTRPATTRRLPSKA